MKKTNLNTIKVLYLSLISLGNKTCDIFLKIIFDKSGKVIIIVNEASNSKEAKLPIRILSNADSTTPIREIKVNLTPKFLLNRKSSKLLVFFCDLILNITKIEDKIKTKDSGTKNAITINSISSVMKIVKMQINDDKIFEVARTSESKRKFSRPTK